MEYVVAGFRFSTVAFNLSLLLLSPPSTEVAFIQLFLSVLYCATNVCAKPPWKQRIQEMTVVVCLESSTIGAMGGHGGPENIDGKYLVEPIL